MESVRKRWEKRQSHICYRSVADGDIIKAEITGGGKEPHAGLSIVDS